MPQRAIAARAVALVLLLCFSVATAQTLPGPTERLSDGDAHLDWFAPPQGPALVFGFGEPGHPVAPPPLDEQGEILGRLLDELAARHADLPPSIQVLLGDSRDALTRALDQRLLDPSSNWDSIRGRPEHGRLGDALRDELRPIVRSSPLAAAFSAHGYTLDLRGVGKIDIRPVDGARGPRLPQFIDWMDLSATRTVEKPRRASLPRQLRAACRRSTSWRRPFQAPQAWRPSSR